MAADILAYLATHVPVGDDQKQHLELSRDIAQKFNNDFKSTNYFPIVEPVIPKEISRVMSLRDGNKKMSKSEESDYSRINLKDNKDLIDQKIRKAKTDNEAVPAEEKDLKNRPEASNLISIYASINNIKVIDSQCVQFDENEDIYFKKCPFFKNVSMGAAMYFKYTPPQDANGDACSIKDKLHGSFNPSTIFSSLNSSA